MKYKIMFIWEHSRGNNCNEKSDPAQILTHPRFYGNTQGGITVMKSPIQHKFKLIQDFMFHLITPASVAQLDAPSDWRPGGHGFKPRRGRQHPFVEIDHEIFSTVILSLPLIQEGQLSVSGERMCTILVNRLED